MIPNRTALSWVHATAVALALGVAPVVASAQTSSPKPAAKPKARAKAPAKKPVPPPVEYVPAEAASAEQIDAAERVYYGVYDCEFKQTIDITKSVKFPAFVDLKHGKAIYLMKPVLSSTGAIRLEDIRGETLMVQISSKSMLLNVKTAQRLVDDCVSPRQHELMEAARAAKAAAVAAAAASAAETKAAETKAAEAKAAETKAAETKAVGTGEEAKAREATPASGAASATVK